MNPHSLFHSVPQDKAPKILNLIVEIEKGGFIKYEYDHKMGVLVCDRILHGPVHFPVNYCDVPRTWNKFDKDPLDAVVYSKGNIMPGTLVRGRVIGIMEMEDTGEWDSKIICVNDADPRYNHVQELTDLREWDLKDLKSFFETYKIAQKGFGTVKVGNFLGREEAYKVIEQALKDYEVEFGNK